MSKAEMYPWSMLSEVGDYFIVPYHFKQHSYVSMLISQRNYKCVDSKKYSASKTHHGTIVMVIEFNKELPAYEFKTEQGILCSSSRKFAQSLEAQSLPVGERPQTSQRRLVDRVAVMSVDERNSNLPWWYDPKNGKLLWNGKVADEADTARYMGGWHPPTDFEYIEKYGLDYHLNKKVQHEGDQDEEEDYGDHPIIGDDDEQTDS